MDIACGDPFVFEQQHAIPVLMADKRLKLAEFFAQESAPWSGPASHEDMLAEFDRLGKPMPGLFLIRAMRSEGVMVDVLLVVIIVAMSREMRDVAC